MIKRFRSVGVLLALFTASVYGHGSLSIDLTHPIPTFAPSSEDPMKADLSKPHFGSVFQKGWSGPSPSIPPPTSSNRSTKSWRRLSSPSFW